MHCFNHTIVEAVGICKNCNKGLCRECISELENGIACKSTCVDEVNALNVLIAKNKKAYSRTAGSFYRNAFIYGALSIVFIVWGIKENYLRNFLVPAGIIFLIGAGFMVMNANKYNKK